MANMQKERNASEFLNTPRKYSQWQLLYLVYCTVHYSTVVITGYTNKGIAWSGLIPFIILRAEAFDPCAE